MQEEDRNLAKALADRAYRRADRRRILTRAYQGRNTDELQQLTHQLADEAGLLAEYVLELLNQQPKRPTLLTGGGLAEWLLDTVNPGAVAVLCVDGFEYAPFIEVVDESGLDEGDGVVGNVLLRLDPTSEIAKFLKIE